MKIMLLTISILLNCGFLLTKDDTLLILGIISIFTFIVLHRIDKLSK